MTQSTELTELVHKMRQGDPDAREQIVASIYERLIKLSRKMIRGGSRSIRRWEQTEDLAHAAWFRIQRALEDPNLTLENDSHLFRLAARHMRFELIDIYRKHQGAQGIAANHQTVARDGMGADVVPEHERYSANQTNDPQRIAAWGEFHQLVEDLPDREKEVVDLLWYQGLKQQDAADLVGVDVKTIKRRWRDVKLRLSEQLDGSLVDL